MMTGAPILELRNVHAFYGKVQVLFDVNISIRPGELVCLLGGNASGKSTTLKTILGIVKPGQGDVFIKGEKTTGRPTRDVIRKGVAIVPENRRIFPRMSVLENLEMGAYVRTDTARIREDIERSLEIFPRLRERLQQDGQTLSGGEQQMLAMARALLSNPDVLLMDEPSMGLSPLLVENQFELIHAVNTQGTAVFMVEQNANMALSIADRGYVLQTGSVVLEDDARALLENPQMQEAYLCGGDGRDV